MNVRCVCVWLVVGVCRCVVGVCRCVWLACELSAVGRSVDGRGEQIRKTQDKPQWVVAQGLLSALTIPGFS